MARSVLDIVIKLSKQGGADKETVKGLVQVKSAIMEAAAVAGTLVAAGYTIKKVFDATVGTMVAYADQVRTISQVSGLSAEESSKLIQMTDDLKISQEELLKVMQKNGDEYDYSVQGLAAMSDQYLALGSSQEKAEFMQKRFGKSWGNFVELMEQGSRRIMSSAEGIDEALILDQAALDSAREYEKQVDSLSDSFMALKVSLGREALPAVNNYVNELNVGIEAERRFNKEIEDKGALFQTYAKTIGYVSMIEAHKKDITFEASLANMELAEGMKELTSITQENSVATEGNAEAMKAASEANQSFLSLLGSVNTTYMGYMEETKNLEQERIDLEKEKQGLIAQGYSEQSTQIQEVNGKIAENQAQTTAAANQFELDNKRILLGYLERKLTADGILDDKELLWLTEKGVAWGVYHQTAVAETQAMINEANGLIEGLITEKTFTLSLNTIYSQAGDSTQNNVFGNGSRNAAGTHGFEPVPAGHPRDTFAILANSNEEYLVRDKGSTTMAGGMSGGAVNVTVNFHSVVSTADRETAKGTLEPIIFDAIRKARAQGRV